MMIGDILDHISQNQQLDFHRVSMNVAHSKGHDDLRFVDCSFTGVKFSFL